MISDHIIEKIVAMAAANEKTLRQPAEAAGEIQQGICNNAAGNILNRERISLFNHEVRTAMNAIMGFSRIINTENITAEFRKSCTEVICQESEHLLDVFNQILQVLDTLHEKNVQAS
jgi:signal transduction histidine kinase